jgi:phosphoribosyl 1,2-cyclic phosphodiesterase
MPLYFKSLSSSSSGNCLVLWSDRTRVILDCGIRSIRGTRGLLEDNLEDPKNVDEVIISHMHGDHINRYSLKVLNEYGLRVRVHERCLDQLREKHIKDHRFNSLDLKTFSDESFIVGDLSFQPFEVPHHPNYPNFGFVVSYKEGKSWKNAVFVTDFNDGEAALDHFTDADFIFVESNHDLDLLAKYFNPNSRYHMSNPKTAQLLCMTCSQSKKKLHTVMLGHLSPKRNTESFALEEMQGAFRENGLDLNFRLFAAPLYVSSRVVKI